MQQDYGDSGPDSTPNSSWMSSASSSSGGPGMTGSRGGAYVYRRKDLHEDAMQDLFDDF
jgi:hypothetical protein